MLLFTVPGAAQNWEFVKEKEGIRLYVAKAGTSGVKSFRGEVTFRGDFSGIISMIGNPSNLAWWGDDVKQIEVLEYIPGERIRYYFVYDVPWPFSDRDLVADVKLGEDPVTGIRTVFSKPLKNRIPEHPDLVRVTDFWQKWTLRPLAEGMISVTLEGFIDPAGSVPAWLYNMVIIDKPYYLLRQVRERAGTP